MIMGIIKFLKTHIINIQFTERINNMSTSKRKIEVEGQKKDLSLVILPVIGSPHSVSRSNVNVKDSDNQAVKEHVKNKIKIIRQPSLKKSGSTPTISPDHGDCKKVASDTLTRKTEKLTPLMVIEQSPKSVESISLDSKNDSLEEELKEEQTATDPSDDELSKNGSTSGQSVKTKTNQVVKSLKLFKMVHGVIIEQKEEDLPDSIKVVDRRTNQRTFANGFKINIQQTEEGNSISNLSEEDEDVPTKKKVLQLTEKQNNGNIEIIKKDNESIYSRFNELDIEKEEIKKQHQEVLKEIWEAEPIFQLSHKYAEGSGSPAWRKKQMRHKIMYNTNIKEETSEESMSLSDEEKYNSDVLPGDKDSDKDSDKEQKKKNKKNNSIQEKLARFGEKIKTQTEKAIKIEKYPELFGYQIYDGYRPGSLAQCRDYLEFLINGDIYNEEATPQHIKDYLQKDLETDLPEFINQKHILRFDQNFECGNLDSAYIHNCEEYNLLLKVDSNTKEFRIGVKYTFNIFNFTRSMEKFYREGMNIITKAEKIEKFDEIIKSSCPQSQAQSRTGSQNGSRAPSPTKQPGQWRYGTCQNILFEPSELSRPSMPDRQKLLYQKLTFSYTFKEEDLGKAVHFAYALPYSYSDLLSDLRQAKRYLISNLSPSSLSPETAKPTLKVLEKKDYLDAAKYKHFTHYNNDDYIPLISPGTMGEEGIQSTGSGNPRKIRPLNAKNISNRKSFLDDSINTPGVASQLNPDNKKVSQFAQQHEQIKRLGQASMYQKTSKLETQFIKDENEGNGQMRDLFWKDATIKDKEDPQEEDLNFEITNEYLHYRQEVISQSMGGLNIYQITITKRREAGSIRHKKKHVIYIQARLHAAETHGSLIMSRIIKEFSQNYEKYDNILTNNIVKLIPMVNPDGVVLGNSRSSLAGVDLNRRWCNPNATIHPELYFLKVNMKATAQQSAGISIFCDLHGHNKNQNCFIYGCNKAPNEGLLSWTKTRLLPKIIASVEPIFDFNMCKFSQERTKYNTARVVIWNEFKVTNSFTLETSMHGMQKQSKNSTKSYARKGDIVQLVRDDFDSIGVNLLVAFKQFFYLEAELEKEFKNTGGWLKKKKLDEVTGVTARKKMEQNELFEKQKKLMMGDSKSEKKKRNLPMRHQSFNAVPIVPLGGKLHSNKRTSSRNVLGNQGLTQLQVPSKALVNKKESQRIGGSCNNSCDESEKLSARTTQKKPEKEGKKKKDEMPSFLAQYFSKNELDEAIQDSKKPIEKTPRGKGKKSKKIEIIEESDSEPSCDNFEKEQMKDVFGEALSETDYKEQFPEVLEPPKIEIPEPIKSDKLQIVPEVSEVLKEASQEEQVNEMETIKDQMASIEDYKMIAEQLKAAKAESKQLTEKFEKLSRQINKKMKGESKRILQPQLIIQTPMPFRGGWHDIQANNTNAHARHNSTSYQHDTILEQDIDIISAGPKSGEGQTINRMRNLSNQIEAASIINTPQPGTLFPAVQQNDRKTQGGTATSAARANKYKARNTILNVSQFNMDVGMTPEKAPTTKQPNPHVHPEYSQRFNATQRQNKLSLQGMIIGQSVQINQTEAKAKASPNIQYPKEMKLYNTSSKKRPQLGTGSKRMTMNIEQGSQLLIQHDYSVNVNNPQSVTHINNARHFNHCDSNFNQALKNDLINRNNLQESIKTTQSFFSSSISPQQLNKNQKFDHQRQNTVLIDNQQFNPDQQNKMKIAIDHGKIQAKRKSSPMYYQQLNTSSDQMASQTNKKRYLYPPENEESSNQFTHGDEIIRSPIVRIRGSKNAKAKFINETEPRQSQSRRTEKNSEHSSNFFQSAIVSQNPKIALKAHQFKKKEPQINEPISRRNIIDSFSTPPNMPTDGTQSAVVHDEKLRIDQPQFFGTATGKYGIRQEYQAGINYQFDQAAKQLQMQNELTSNFSQLDSDYFNQKQFKRRVKEEAYTPVQASQFSHQKFFEGEHQRNIKSSIKKNRNYSRDNDRYISSPQINQRSNIQQLQQSMVNYEDSFSGQESQNQAKGSASQSITHHAITPQKKMEKIMQINSKTDPQRMLTEEDQQKFFRQSKLSPGHNRNQGQVQKILNQLIEEDQ